MLGLRELEIGAPTTPASAAIIVPMTHATAEWASSVDAPGGGQLGTVDQRPHAEPRCVSPSARGPACRGHGQSHHEHDQLVRVQRDAGPEVPLGRRARSQARRGVHLGSIRDIEMPDIDQKLHNELGETPAPHFFQSTSRPP